MIRNPMLFWSGFAQHLLLALIVGFFYLRIDSDTESLHDRISAVFFIMINVTLVPMSIYAFGIPYVRPIFNRERSSGKYGVLSFYMAITAAGIPLEVFYCLMEVCISYWMIGLNPDPGRFFLFLLIILVNLMCWHAIAIAMSSLSTRADIASILVLLPLNLWLVSSGIFLR